MLKAVSPYIRYFESNRVAIDLPAEEICLAIAWNGDYASGLKAVEDENLDVNLGYNVPIEGSNIWMDTWSLLANAPNVDEAHLFLNYLLRPKVIASVSNDQRYANFNNASKPYLIPQVADDPAVTHPPEIVALLQQRSVHDIKDRRRVNRLFARFKARVE